MSGGKRIHVFKLQYYFCMSGVAFCGLEAIQTKFVRQPEE